METVTSVRFIHDSAADDQLKILWKWFWLIFFLPFSFSPPSLQSLNSPENVPSPTYLSPEIFFYLIEDRPQLRNEEKFRPAATRRKLGAQAGQAARFFSPCPPECAPSQPSLTAVKRNFAALHYIAE